MTTQKTIGNMTRKEIVAVPMIETRSVSCCGFVIIPTRKKFTNGYNRIEVVAIDEYRAPIGKCVVNADVLNLINYDHHSFAKTSKIQQEEINVEWIIDCIGKSGLLRVFTSQGVPIRILLGSGSVDIEGFKKGDE
jgi:hypothetical protein